MANPDPPPLNFDPPPLSAPSTSTTTPATAESNAAALIQRNYRGYRSRRHLAGVGIDASTRWSEVLRDVQYHEATRPQARAQGLNADKSCVGPRAKGTKSFAAEEWKRLAMVARRAGQDETSETDGEEGMDEKEVQRYRERKRQAKKERDENARTMGLEYFLEMVDEKHRYGSHLRQYHAEWKKADTHENFFYWLDHGDGRTVEVPTCSRERLDVDQVRYLNREERQSYLVRVDDDGRLRWVKNNERLNTTYEFRDSIKGIVSAKDPTPAFREPVHGRRHKQQDPNKDDSSDSDSESSDDSTQEGKHYVNRDLDNAKGLKKIQYVSAAAVLNHLLQSTTKKNTWIFVADTSFRLYVGIKQSGAFQHSSFLHGGRISAAGLIKIKDGQLRRLSPLSGHYRPPTRNFRAFVHSLKDAGVDMSRVSISRSYAVLLGLEGYIRTKKKAEMGLHHVETQAERIFKPEQAKDRREREFDKTESAKKERAHLEKLAKVKKDQGLAQRLKSKLGLGE